MCMKRPFSERFGDFMEGKGFYIVLFLCVAAIGISGYYLFATLSPEHDPGTPVAGPAQITVTPTPSSSPSLAPAPAVTPPAPAVASARPAAPSPAASSPPSATPAPAVSPASVPSAAPTVFSWPVRGEVLSAHSVEVLAYDPTMGDWRTHSGVDIAASTGDPVTAVAAGTVIDVVQDALMGATVYLDHGGGLTSVYANLASVPTVEVGDTVAAGQTIGSVGQTAIAESAVAPHLHFEMTKDGSPVDPLDLLPQ